MKTLKPSEKATSVLKLKHGHGTLQGSSSRSSQPCGLDAIVAAALANPDDDGCRMESGSGGDEPGSSSGSYSGNNSKTKTTKGTSCVTEEYQREGKELREDENNEEEDEEPHDHGICEDNEDDRKQDGGLMRGDSDPTALQKIWNSEENQNVEQSMRQVKETKVKGFATGSLKKPEKIVPCPRCNSSDTKFCYYNNYNINQPRHFCKMCQRYWTAGGTLRNVPAGSGRRKNKASAQRNRTDMSVSMDSAMATGYGGNGNGKGESASGVDMSFGSLAALGGANCSTGTLTEGFDTESVLTAAGSGYRRETGYPAGRIEGSIHDQYRGQDPLGRNEGEVGGGNMALLMQGEQSHGSTGMMSACDAREAMPHHSHLAGPPSYSPELLPWGSIPPVSAPMPPPWPPSSHPYGYFNGGGWGSYGYGMPWNGMGPGAAVLPGSTPWGSPASWAGMPPWWGHGHSGSPWAAGAAGQWGSGGASWSPVPMSGVPAVSGHSVYGKRGREGVESEGGGQERKEAGMPWVPKMLRTEEPGDDVSRGSVWTRVGLGAPSPRDGVRSSGGILRPFPSKEMPLAGDSMRYANPAAVGRSLAFQEF